MVEAMDGFVDIHTHILPRADDGPKDILAAMKLARMAWEDGIGTLFLTPHYRGEYRENTPAWLRENFALFCQMLQQFLPQMRLYLGSEAHYEAQLPRLLESGRCFHCAVPIMYCWSFRTTRCGCGSWRDFGSATKRVYPGDRPCGAV